MPRQMEEMDVRNEKSLEEKKTASSGAEFAGIVEYVPLLECGLVVGQLQLQIFDSEHCLLSALR
jgi:hypothetical protein